MGGEFGWGTLQQGWRKGPWTDQEDKLLLEHVNLYGEGRWNCVSSLTGLRRTGKSCRLRWVNYLRPDLKRGKITPHEESIILELHAKWGNRWSAIAQSLPGRTDNAIKNYWRTHFKKSKPKNNVEKAKARYLRRQPEQQEMQEMKRIIPQLEEASLAQEQQHQYQIDMKRTQLEEASLAQEMQEMASMHHISTTMFQGGASMSDQEGTWGGLWNLDDMHVDQDQVLYFY